MAGIDIDATAAAIAGGDFKSLDPVLLELERFLTLRTYLGGYELSDADKKVWTSIRTSKVAIGLVRKGSFANVTRWFSFIEAAHPEVAVDAPAGKATKGKKGGANYNIGLTGTENGVVTRFPPEPS
jgi:glutamyl-tRNA synthetase